MKKLASIFFIFSNFAFCQSLTITPNADLLKINKIGIGLDHRTSNNLVGVGTYVNGSFGIIQTHTNHPLGFATNSSSIYAILQTNGNFGLGGITNPQYFLDVNGRSRIRHNGNTAGIWFSKTDNLIDQGSFFGNINDNSAGIWIGNAWRFGLSDAGIVNIPNLAGSGTRPVGTDAAGNLVALSSTATAFSVTSSLTNLILGTGQEGQLNFNIENYDTSNSFGSDFLVPSTGVYHFTVNIGWQGNASGRREITLRNQSGSYLGSFFSSPTNNQIFVQNFSTDLYLTQGTSVRVWVSQDSGSNLNVIAAYRTFFNEPMFSGFKVN
jgi:hypothetical protein